MSEIRFPELGYYALPGHVSTPADIYEEVRSGEAAGLGSVWISERFNTKNVDVLSGAAAAVSNKMGIVAGLISNINIRHPLVLASYGSTMAALSGNRFALGFGRGLNALSDMTGTPRINFQIMTDYVTVLRALWGGEKVQYNGPIGQLNGVSLGLKLDNPPPLIAAAQGDKTFRWAGAHCDGVVINSLWSAAAVRHSIQQVRQGAEEAGRDPASVKVWTILMTACEIPEEDMLNLIVRRMNTYIIFPGFFEDLCRVNGWDVNELPRIRATLNDIDSDRGTSLLGDENTTRDIDKLRRMRDAYPEQWIRDATATGDADRCGRAYQERFDAGSDGILIHGSRPRHLTSLLDVWPRYRPAGRFEGMSAVPGR